MAAVATVRGTGEHTVQVGVHRAGDVSRGKLLRPEFGVGQVVAAVKHAPFGVGGQVGRRHQGGFQ
ncbi:hypothetical protein FQZ97_1205610 [compost metagenome]